MAIQKVHKPFRISSGYLALLIYAPTYINGKLGIRPRLIFHVELKQLSLRAPTSNHVVALDRNRLDSRSLSLPTPIVTPRGGARTMVPKINQFVPQVPRVHRQQTSFRSRAP